MNRRELLATLAAVALSPTAARAQNDGKLVVVKGLLFSCPVCRASEAQDPAIVKALALHEGTFVPAPLPVGTGARERMYYAARALGTQHERVVRDSLYRGTQDASVQLDDEIQVMVWLQTDIGSSLDINWTALVDAAMGADSKAALTRAARLAVSAAVSDVPAYIFLRQNEIIDTIDPPKVGNGSLREAVLARIQSLTQPSKKG